MFTYACGFYMYARSVYILYMYMHMCTHTVRHLYTYACAYICIISKGIVYGFYCCLHVYQ